MAVTYHVYEDLHNMDLVLRRYQLETYQRPLQIITVDAWLDRQVPQSKRLRDSSIQISLITVNFETYGPHHGEPEDADF